MTSTVLLLNVNQCDTPYPVFPLGLGYVASALREDGHEVVLMDINRDREELPSRIAELRPDVVGLSLRNIDDVDIQTRRFFVPDLVDTVTLIRKHTDAPVVIGGSAFSLFPERLLEMSGANFGIRSEGERSMRDLVAALGAGLPVGDIPGLVYRDGDTIAANEPQTCVSADIPHAFRPQQLTEYYLQHSAMLNIQTQRGCAHRCCYCTYPLIEGTRFRFREPGAVADDIEAGIHAGGHYFFVVDSIFNTRKEHVHAVCEEIIRRELNIKWCCFLRPSGMDDDTMALMARAGLTHIEYGSDSFCDSVLEAYGKDFTFEQILQASELACAHNVHYAHFLIAGGPTETEDTLREGFANAQRLNRTVIFPYIGMRLYPGTRLYEQARTEGIIEDDTDLLEPFYYITPNLTESRIRALLEEFASRARNWVVGEIPPEQQRVTKMLRDRGVEGPLWEYLVR